MSVTWGSMTDAKPSTCIKSKILRTREIGRRGDGPSQYIRMYLECGHHRDMSYQVYLDRQKNLNTTLCIECSDKAVLDAHPKLP